MIEDVLLAHFEKYPRMEPRDAVKLIYQHVFGPEHLIRDKKKALDMLVQEMAGLKAPMPDEALYESIGGGLCRLNLRPCAARGIPAEDICRLFLKTAETCAGDEKRFRQGIRALQALAENGETPFEPVLLDVFLARYPQKPQAVHHSDVYRQAYAPAYRVVSQKLVKEYLRERRGDR